MGPWSKVSVDSGKFDAYHQWSMDSFYRDKPVVRCLHGEAPPSAFQQALNDVVTAFPVDKNVNNFADALVLAARESQLPK